MKLLIVTQKVDRNDTMLGFFHGWIIELAKHFESIVVICLQKGECDLPSNVKVLSLGKEEKKSRLQYIVRFYKYIWNERSNYDAVFVHMNQEYVLLGGLLWRLWGKKVTMWRNHHAGSPLTDVAASFCQKVFCTSKYSYTAKYKNMVLMPVGVDLGVFKPDSAVTRKPKSILFLGRISPSKNAGLFLEALVEMKNRELDFSANIHGDTLPTDEAYLGDLTYRAFKLSLGVKFHAGIPHRKTQSIYSANEVYVNLSSSGMYDKTIFEAMACGCLVIASNDNLKGEIDERLLITTRNPLEISRKLEEVLALPEVTKKEMVRTGMAFAQKHSLSLLAQRLYDQLKD